MNHNCRSALLYEALKKRILILDGAMGTMLQSFHPEEADFRGDILKDHPVPLKGNNDVLGLTRPEFPRNVHRMYLEAGADIIMLDNMPINTMKKCVELIDKKAIVEASGNVNLDTIKEIAATGVDIISSSAIVASCAPTFDLM